MSLDPHARRHEQTDESQSADQSSTTAFGVCVGSSQSTLKCVGPDDPRFFGLLKKMDHFRDSWRSKLCQYKVDVKDLDTKGRCQHCQALDKNIRKEQFPELYKEVEKVTDRSISEAVIDDDDKFRQRILHQLSSVGEKEEETQDSELIVAAAQLRLAGRHEFDLGNNLSFVCCQGCDSFEIRKYRANASTHCERCRASLKNSKRCAIRKEANKEQRTSAKSRTPIDSLDDEEKK